MARFEQLVPADGFGADEMFLQVGVDGTRAILRASIDRDGPGAAFVFAGGEKGNHAQQAVSRADEARQPAFS